MKRFAFLIFVLLTLTACATPAPTAIVTPTASPTPSPLPSTETPPPPTATATATATKLATATPESTVTEAFAPIEISTNPDKPTAITLEDVTSGRLAASERKLLQPFPPEAFMTGWTPMAEGDLQTLNIDTSASLGRYKEDPNTRPEKIVSFSSLALKMDNGKTQNLTVIGIQVLNTDSTSTIFHLAFETVNLQQYLDLLKNKYAAGFITNSPYPEISDSYWWTYLLNIQPDIPALANQLQNIGIAPKELENYILPFIFRSAW